MIAEAERVNEAMQELTDEVAKVISEVERVKAEKRTTYVVALDAEKQTKIDQATECDLPYAEPEPHQDSEGDAMRVNDMESSLLRLDYQLHHLQGRLVETGLSREERGQIEAMIASRWRPWLTTKPVLETIRSKKQNCPDDKMDLKNCPDDNLHLDSPHDYQS